MSRQWTDEDVAEMLGWKEWNVGTGIWGPTDCIYLQHTPHFGLSTPPSAEADANVARYVLPWLRARSMDTQESVMNALIEVWIDTGQPLGTFAMWTVLCMDGPTLCTAALEAYHAGSKDNE